ncbi:ParD-like family protein [Stappia indica]|uniref:ParD-like antitoxin of type II toxin-antitoxin system n=1 Tax=Stappia indica TaxID=538381 RepID=A0A285SWU1_9HYPH|nr:ParD-like family protein [Stappia indica]SOC13105.1 ParD-like antitoxin of type II toxin-antitoxin system [Stappia indica]
MGIVSIDEELHDQLRRASKVSYRSINAQAAYWIRIGMLCETNPGLSFSQIMQRELAAAGVAAPEAAAEPAGA